MSKIKPNKIRYLRDKQKPAMYIDTFNGDLEDVRVDLNQARIVEQKTGKKLSKIQAFRVNVENYAKIIMGVLHASIDNPKSVSKEALVQSFLYQISHRDEDMLSFLFDQLESTHGLFDGGLFGTYVSIIECIDLDLEVSPYELVFKMKEDAFVKEDGVLLVDKLDYDEVEEELYLDFASVLSNELYRIAFSEELDLYNSISQEEAKREHLNRHKMIFESSGYSGDDLELLMSAERARIEDDDLLYGEEFEEFLNELEELEGNLDES